jgi:proline-specific peptidase
MTRESFVTADGRRLAYRRDGDGPILVCHPGGPGLSGRYLADLGGLGESLTLIMLDPRGTGDSSRPDDAAAYALDDYVADLEELREHLGLERMQLLGFSHGAVVALSYAIAHPDRLERMVVAGGSARFGPDQLEAIEAGVAARSEEPWFEKARAALDLELEGNASDEELRQAMADMLPVYFHRYDERAERYAAEVEGDLPNGDAMRLWEHEIFRTFDLRDRLPSISAPALVITGDDDFVTGPTCASEVAALIPGSKLVILPECGHMLWVEQGRRFVSEVTAFLDVG